MACTNQNPKKELTMITSDSGERPSSMRSSPNLIDFGVSPPRGSANATFTISNARSDALLTATILEDDSHGRFRILSLTSCSTSQSEAVSNPGEIRSGRTPGSQPKETGEDQIGTASP